MRRLQNVNLFWNESWCRYHFTCHWLIFCTISHIRSIFWSFTTLPAIPGLGSISADKCPFFWNNRSTKNRKQTKALVSVSLFHEINYFWSCFSEITPNFDSESLTTCSLNKNNSLKNHKTRKTKYFASFRLVINLALAVIKSRYMQLKSYT